MFPGEKKGKRKGKYRLSSNNINKQRINQREETQIRAFTNPLLQNIDIDIDSLQR